MIPDDRSEELEKSDPDGADVSAREESEEVFRRDYFGGAPGTEGKGRSSEQLWLISYSDFMTIMMIFFLAMYGYSHLLRQKVEERVDRFSAMASQMKADMKEDVRIMAETDKVTVELGEEILFESGRAELAPRSARTLAALGSSIRGTEGDVIVEGHTDNIPISGGAYASNWELSAARAFSVIQALEKAGVPPQRLTAWGFGENRPVTDNETPENRRRNRRIDVVILKKRIQAAS